MKPVRAVAVVRHWAVCSIAFFMIVWSPMLLAEPENLTPTQLVQTAISDVLADMRTHASLYQQQPDLINALVEQKVVPYFDFLRMTQLAMARHWNTASDAQRAAVAAAFQEQFVAIYGQQLFAYRDTAADIEPLPGATDHKATLKLKATDQRGEQIALFIRLEKNTDKWHVIDINVDGISYVVTNRSQFSEAIENNGIDGLIEYLHEAKSRPAP